MVGAVSGTVITAPNTPDKASERHLATLTSELKYHKKVECLRSQDSRFYEVVGKKKKTN